MSPTKALAVFLALLVVVGTVAVSLDSGGIYNQRWDETV